MTVTTMTPYARSIYLPLYHEHFSSFVFFTTNILYIVLRTFSHFQFLGIDSTNFTFFTFFFNFNFFNFLE